MQRFISRLAGIFIVIGVILTFEGVKDTMDSKKQPVDFNTMTEKDLKNDMIVEGDILYNYGVFEEEYRTTYGIKTGDSDYTYLIPIGEKKYMGIKNQTNDQQIALDDQTNKTIDFLLGNSTVEPTPFHFKGRIITMSSQDKGYMRDYLLDMGYTESEVDGYILGYCIECVDFKGGMGEVGLGAALLIIAFLMIITPTLERKKQERLLYTHDTVTSPVINNNNKNADTFSSNANESPQTLKMPADSNLDSSYSREEDFDYPEQGVSEEEKPKSGLSLRLKDE